MPKISSVSTKEDLKKLANVLRDEIRENTRTIIAHFNESQGTQTAWIKEDFNVVNTKLDAIMSGEVLVTRKQIERLLNALKANGIELNPSEILAA